jgi:hypothetical protein
VSGVLDLCGLEADVVARVERRALDGAVRAIAKQQLALPGEIVTRRPRRRLDRRAFT